MTGHAVVSEYDPRATLPRGKVAIQASAGTGKTYALTELACRFVAEGRVTAAELLIVTFTRAATNEIRGRVRDRLVALARTLHDPPGAPPRHQGEDVLVSLLQERSDLDEVVERVDRAVVEFDATTVTTIHGFAGQMLGALGVRSGVERAGGRLQLDADELRYQSCADVIVGASADGVPPELLPSVSRLTECVRLVMERPDLDIEPALGDGTVAAAVQLERQLIDEAVRRAAESRVRNGSRTFDDLLVDLRSGLRGPQGPAVVESMRRRFGAVLIDEFQDTDSVQWDIFSTVFDGPGFEGAMVLVGDPKQAIYGFRGADIHTYRRAIRDAPDVRSLTVNWRSDPAVLASLDLLLEGTTFGSPDIEFVPVRPPPGRRDGIARRDGGALPALALRVAEGDAIQGSKDGKTVEADAARAAIHADMVGVVLKLLDGATLRKGAATAPVEPSDIAVLVPSHARAKEVQQALVKAGIPAVVAQSGSVLDSRAADHLRWLLAAMVRPSDLGAVRMFALSWFRGWRPVDLDAVADDDLVGLQDDLRRWSDLLTVRAPAEVFATIWAETDLGSRVLGRLDGERDMTDLGHLVEYLAAGAATGRVGAAALLGMLDKQPRPEEDDTGTAADDPVASRVASDAPAVVIMTIHTAKGLEFPVVLLPHLWQQPMPGKGTVLYPHPGSGRWTLDLRTEGVDGELKRRAAAEAMGERLRLLYVAMTRAKHQTVLWWAPGYGSDRSALARVLFRDRGDGAGEDLAVAPNPKVPPRGTVQARLASLVARAGGTISLDGVDAASAPTPRWAGRDVADLAPLSLATPVLPDRTTRRWSFSAMVEDDPDAVDRPDAGAGDEREDDIEPELVADATVDLDAVAARPLADLPAGARFGNLVHSVLEVVDFAAPDLETELASAVDGELAWRALDLTPVQDPDGGPGAGRRLVVDGLATALRSPLGPLLDERSLAAFGTRDRLSELSFDLRLATAGPAAALGTVVSGLGAVFAGDAALAAWAGNLADRTDGTTLAGHLTGSIDLVLRVSDGGGPDRYVVCDYKTNALDPPGRPPGVDSYGRRRLSLEMARHDYPLQAALYSVALHRYLRWRVPDYDPDVHLGGVAYLFVRGMVAGRPPGHGPAGVFDWRFPAGFVEMLSDALDGVHADRAGATRAPVAS